MRVPFIAVSAFAKHHYVSHRVYDPTSILRFIETKFNLPALIAARTRTVARGERLGDDAPRR